MTVFLIFEDDGTIIVQYREEVSGEEGSAVLEGVEFFSPGDELDGVTYEQLQALGPGEHEINVLDAAV